MDAVRLKNMQFYAYHGARQGEAEDGQRFEVDVEMCGSLKEAALTDDLTKTYDYDAVYKIVKKSVTGCRFHLIETLAEQIAGNLLESYPAATVRVIVRKPHIPVPGVLDGAEVEIVRGPLSEKI